MNARKELEDVLKSKAFIKCALIWADDYWDGRQKRAVLKTNHNAFDYENFLKELDFDYDSGFGSQILHGCVWLEDGTWLSRGEYDGSEWWEHNIMPPIPTDCLPNAK